MRKKAAYSLLALALVALGAALLWRASHGPRHTNLLLITVDTTRPDHLGCYGFDEALTPAIDGLAARGVVFDNAMTCVPITLPSHTTMFTGLLPAEHGIHVNGKNGVHPDLPLLAEILQRRGYQTAAFVASPVLASSYGLARGFEVYDEPDDTVGGPAPDGFRDVAADPQHEPYRLGNEVLDSALAWLEARVGRSARAAGRAQAPFFTWIHLYDPHLPGHWHRELFGDRFHHPYDAELAFMDRQVGRALTFLKDNGLEENTAVVVVGDHGEGLGDKGESSHGFFVWSATIRVPLIFALPDRTTAGLRLAETTTLADLLPTILDLLDVDPAVYGSPDDLRNVYLAGLHERSLAKALVGQPLAPRTATVETQLPLQNCGWAPLSGLITPQWKYIRAPHPELYDRSTDSRDLTNVVSNYPAVVAELDAALAAIEETHNPVAAPEVALSPQEAARLTSLGYAGGSQYAAPPPRPMADMIDVKDMIPVIDVQTDVRRRLQTGDLGEETLALCDRILEASPTTAIFHTWRGMLLAAQRKPGEAMPSFERALQLAPDNMTVHNNLAIIFAQTGRTADAVEHFQTAARLKPTDESVRANLATAHNQLGYELGQRGDFTNAIVHLTAALESRPNFAVAHNNLGMALMGAKRPREALHEFARAVELQPDYAIARHNLKVARRLADAPAAPGSD